MFLVSMKIVSIVIGVILIVLALIGIIILILINKRNKKMFLNVESSLQDYSKDKEIALRPTKLFGFDYILEDKASKTFIKIVPNFNAYEILINSSTKWQIKKDPNDDSISMVEGIDESILQSFSNETKKINKLFVIYPSSKLLMMAINECEYSFVYPETDVHGYRVINYSDLKYLIKSKNIDL